MIKPKDCSLGPKIGVLARLQRKKQIDIANQIRISRLSVSRFFNGHTEVRARDLTDMLAVLGINIEEQIEAKIKLHFPNAQVPDAGS